MKRLFFLIGLLLILTHLNAEEDADVSSMLPEGSNVILPVVCFGGGFPTQNELGIINVYGNPPYVEKRLILETELCGGITALKAKSINGYKNYVYWADNETNQLSVVDINNATVSKFRIRVPKSPTALCSVIAGGVSYVYCASSDTTSGSNPISIINADAFAQDPSQPLASIVNTIKVEASLISALCPLVVGKTPYVYVASEFDDRVLIIDANAQTVIKEISLGTPSEELTPAALTSAIVNGVNYVFSANSQGNSVSVINADTQTLTPYTIPVGVDPAALASVVVDETVYLFCANESDNTVSVINLNAFLENPKKPKKAIRTVEVGYDPSALTSLKAGLDSVVYCGNSGDGTISVIGLKIGPKSGEFKPEVLSTIEGAYVGSYGSMVTPTPITNSSIDIKPFHIGLKGKPVLGTK